MQVVEIFQSIQGEGSLIGTPMIFIRLWGCNMTCTWCDTRYSWAPEFKYITKRQDMSPTMLAEYIQVNYSHLQWINFTGGEPTLWSDEILECIHILGKNFKSCIQTNGKQWPEELFKKLDKICMDIKLPCSGEKSNPSYIARLRQQDEVKYVIQDDIDFKNALQIIKTFPTLASVIIQPVLLHQESLDAYYQRIRWLIEQMQYENVQNYKVLPQYHQLLWRYQPVK